MALKPLTLASATSTTTATTIVPPPPTWHFNFGAITNNHHQPNKVFSRVSRFPLVTFNTKLKPTTAVATNSPTITNTRSSTVEIHVSCYQIIGVSEIAEKDEIVKSVMDLKKAEIEDGYTMEAVVSRQDLLMDVRDKLLFEQEYAGNIREKIPPKSTLRIPWPWLPGALCLLHEVGEEKLVLDIGQKALKNPDAKPYIHDMLLAMALAECAIATAAFEKKKVSRGFDALLRAQGLLRTKSSLGEMTLLSQIEESLEELAPACTLELLGMPQSSENADRRRDALAALRELLRQGLDVESSCQVQDWPSFLSQSLARLSAAEIVDLLPWDDLAMTRKNKKSLQSQNQRVVIDFHCFYMSLAAHIAIGFSSKQTTMINKAKTISECLIASEGIDLKFEEALCSFLLGQGSEAEVLEKLQQLELKSNPGAQSAISGKEQKKFSSATQSLELWLKDAVLSVFADTRDCSSSLTSFFSGEKKSRGIKKSPQIMSPKSNRPLSPDFSSEHRDLVDGLPYLKSSRHLGLAVKQLAPTPTSEPCNAPSVQLERNLNTRNEKFWGAWLAKGNVIENITFVSVLGCLIFFTVKLSVMKFGSFRKGSKWAPYNQSVGKSSLVWKSDSSFSGISGSLKKLFAVVQRPFGDSTIAGTRKTSSLATSLLKSEKENYRRQMPLDEAENLVKQWQSIKAEALGPDHQVDSLSEALDESMLIQGPKAILSDDNAIVVQENYHNLLFRLVIILSVKKVTFTSCLSYLFSDQLSHPTQWQALADTAKARSCYWRFVLLKLTVMRAEILSDEIGSETAEIDAVLEEAAELVDESQPRNPNYYRVMEMDHGDFVMAIFKCHLKALGDSIYVEMEGLLDSDGPSPSCCADDAS
ncbi:hypothetical protein ACFE04_022423 [Oxalis oulophora]